MVFLSEQLQSISIASYILFYLYREHQASIIPSQLNHDLQASFIDVLFCCVKLKEYTPFEPIYLVINGTDPLGRHFGNVRLMFKGGNYNVLDMTNAARAMTQCDQLLVVDHPSWSKKSRAERRLASDYSNPGNWNKDSLVLDSVNVKASWRSGYHKALSLLSVDDATELEDATTTLRCPLKRRVVGVGALTEDWSVEEVEVREEVTLTEGVTNFGEMIDVDAPAEPFFLIDGKRVYKTRSCPRIDYVVCRE